MGGWIAAVHTAEQQHRLGIDELGNPVAAAAVQMSAPAVMGADLAHESDIGPGPSSPLELPATTLGAGSTVGTAGVRLEGGVVQAKELEGSDKQVNAESQQAHAAAPQVQAVPQQSTDYPHATTASLAPDRAAEQGRYL